MDPELTAENEAQRERLAALVGDLGDADLERSLGGGWTVAMSLAHLAFWDRRATLLLDHWERGESPPADEPGWYSDLLNETLLVQWRALPPRETARLALEAAAGVDRKIETLDAAVAAAISERGESWRLQRSTHRREHIEQIERALAAD